MKVAASNIGWQYDNDKEAWDFLQTHGCTGLEVAPSRIVPDDPYGHIDEAEAFARKMYNDYGFDIVSVQSIWFGRNENIFRNEIEYNILLDLTMKAIDFASAMRCPNIVFGCPRQRNVETGAKEEVAEEFFCAVGDYAAAHGTTIALEANPVIYNTNFLNYTRDVFQFVDRLHNPGIKANLDLGAMIENGEQVKELIDSVDLVNHVHLSEPNLVDISRRDIHVAVREELLAENYQGYISLEMKAGDFGIWKQSVGYMVEVFGH